MPPILKRRPWEPASSREGLEAVREHLVPSSGGQGNHVVLRASGAVWCSCKGFQFRGRCRHSAGALGLA